MSAKVLLRAKYDFTAVETEELALKAGEVVSLLFKDESGWAKGVKSTGEKGWFPIDYVDQAPRQSVVVSGTMGKRLLTQEEASQKFMYHRMLPLKTTKVKSLEDTLSCKNAFQIITTEEKSFVVYTESPQEKDAWLRDITKFSSTEELAGSAPIWIPDREAKTCMICAKAFNVVNRRHHCRYCGKVVCGACSPQSIKIPSLSQKPVRVCKVCYEDFKKGELKDAKPWDGSRESYSSDDISRSNSARSSIISTNGLDLESESDPESDVSSPRDSLNKPKMVSSSSSRNMQSPTRTVSSPNLNKEVEESKSRESGSFPIVTQSNSAESPVVSPQTSGSTTPITSPTGTPSKIPPKPSSAKPPVKPKPSTLGESDLIKKRIEYLTKTLDDETIARQALEKNFQLEISELRRENAQLREELEDIKQRILPILEKAAVSE